jgi:hypothetical protein
MTAAAQQANPVSKRVCRMTVIPSSASPRANRGCLWGCLAILAFAFLPLLLAAGTSGWFFYQGYSHDPVLRGAVELVRKDGMAQAALGENIHITGVQGSALSYMWGGESGSYVVTLAGSKGQGSLHVTARSEHGHLTVQRMMLDAPGGSHYDLLHHSVQPGQTPTDSI